MPLWGRIYLIGSQKLPGLQTLNYCVYVKLEVNVCFVRWPPARCLGLFVLAGDASIHGFALSLLRDLCWRFCLDLAIGLRLRLRVIPFVVA
jgi:hypothetical protein